ncbi:hypothetical protein QJQ45_003586 [Haematococcus lacustris]|nr:hypothetical protein QJQ45_003586 [Haematococcus lacustris]
MPLGNATVVVGTGVGANFPSFPFIRCSDYRCSNSPYFLTRPTLSALNSRQLLVCTTLRTRSAQGCMPGQDPTSCSALANSLHALFISTSPRCAPAISNVLLDNANQGFSVQAVNGTQQAVLQVFPLGLSLASANSRQLCIMVRAPCTDMTLLFGSASLDFITYTVTESANTNYWSVMRCCHHLPAASNCLGMLTAVTSLCSACSNLHLLWTGAISPSSTPFSAASLTPSSPTQPTPSKPSSPTQPDPSQPSSPTQPTPSQPTPSQPAPTFTTLPATKPCTSLPQTAPFPSQPTQPPTPTPSPGACSLRDPGLGPLRLGLLSTAPVSPLGATYCFNVRSGRCAAASPCCQMDLHKVEVLIGSGCQGAVVAMTLNGTALPPSYSSATSQGIRYSVLKATNLPALSSPSLAAGVRLCLTLSASSACPNLRSFCLGYDAAGGCRYALFNRARTCCPTSDTGAIP